MQEILTLSKTVAKELFPEYKSSENAFMSKTLEVTGAGALLIEKLNGQLEMKCDKAAQFLLSEEDDALIKPTEYVMQLFGRNSGFSSKSKPEFYGDECALIVLKDTQMVDFGDEQYVIGEKGTSFMSPVFDITGYEESGSDSSDRKGSDPEILPEDRIYPIIPRKCTQYTKADNRATLKPRDYMSIVVWAIWK